MSDDEAEAELLKRKKAKDELRNSVAQKYDNERQTPLPEVNQSEQD